MSQFDVMIKGGGKQARMENLPKDKERFLERIEKTPELPTLPVVAMKVNELLRDSDVTINVLSRAIEKDQAMVSKVLKLVNSAFYGFQSRISNIAHAITILGFNTVRNAIVTISVIDSFSGKEACTGFDIVDFWRHAFAVAVTGRRMAERTRLAIPDEVFVTGILHDIGKLVLAQYCENLFQQVWTSTQENGRSFYEAEQVLLPANHAEIGGRLAQKWQIPPSLVEPIFYHHIGMTSSGRANTVALVHVSDYIVNHFKPDSGDSLGLTRIHPKALKLFQRELETIEDWFVEVQPEIEEACSFFFCC